jgi:hypothetical protein
MPNNYIGFAKRPVFTGTSCMSGHMSGVPVKAFPRRAMPRISMHSCFFVHSDAKPQAASQSSGKCHTTDIAEVAYVIRCC